MSQDRNEVSNDYDGERAALWKISSEYLMCSPLEHSGTKFQIFPSAVTQTFLGFLKQLIYLLKNQPKKKQRKGNLFCFVLFVCLFVFFCCCDI